MKTHHIVTTTTDDTGHRWHLPTGKTIDSETRTFPTRAPTPRRLEVDLATWLSEIEYAA